MADGWFTGTALPDRLLQHGRTVLPPLGLDKNQAIAEVQLQNVALHGMALRELRLPIDVLILSVRRKGSALISHGYTQLELGDWVTVVGSPESVDEVINRFGPV